MSERALIQFEARSIQSYVFASEPIKEIVGGSELIRCATEDWPRDLAPRFGNGRVLSAGGGQCLVIVESRDDQTAMNLARAFVKDLSLTVLSEAPGLLCDAAVASVDWDVPGDLARKRHDLQAQLRERKLRGPEGHPFGTLPVTARCQSTGKAASAIVQEPGGRLRLVSDEVQKKRAKTDAANQRLRRVMPKEDSDDWWPLDLDLLGRSKGVSSYVGVIHVDGNAMGERKEGVLAAFASASNDRFSDALDELSQSIEDAGTAALTALAAWVNQSICRNTGEFAGRFSLAQEAGRLFLPIRSLVYGGDDTTFVCDGRIALAAATEFVRSFEKQKIGVAPHTFKPTACAGIAVIKSHYPFSRGYQLAEALVHSAKARAREISSDAPPSALDWHLAASGLMASLDQIRQREYEIDHASLLMRPLLLTDKADWRNWTEFTRLVHAFQADEWQRRRSKLHRLFETLRDGGGATQVFTERFVKSKRLPALSMEIPDRAYPTTGFAEGRSVYFDAIEALDFTVGIGGR